MFWWNEAVEVIEATEVVEAVEAGEAGEASEVAEADEVNEAAEVLRPEKSLLRTSESWRFLNLALFWCFETENILVESWNIILNFKPFLSEAVEASWCYFFENWFMKLKCPNLLKPLFRHHNSTKSFFLLPLRATYFSTFQYETPSNCS